MADSLIGAEERVELLRHGIVVVDAQAGSERPRVAVTGAGLERVQEVADRVLSTNVELEVLAATPRLIQPLRCRGHMEREAGRLQVRFVLRGDEHVDDIVVAEDEQTVVVFGTVCTAAGSEEGERCEVPYHVYLDAPLGRRTVIDGTTGEVVPYKNVWASLSRPSRTARRPAAPSPRARRPR
jgi:hypothetical protein